MDGSYQALPWSHACPPKLTCSCVVFLDSIAYSKLLKPHSRGANALLEGKTQNSEVLMLGLCSWSFGGVKKGTPSHLGGREGGREQGRMQKSGRGSSFLVRKTCQKFLSLTMPPLIDHTYLIKIGQETPWQVCAWLNHIMQLVLQLHSCRRM